MAFTDLEGLGINRVLVFEDLPDPSEEHNHSAERT